MTADSMGHDQTFKDQGKQHGAALPRTPEVVREEYESQRPAFEAWSQRMKAKRAAKAAKDGKRGAA